jgi:putative ABC transport system permease protein
VAADGSSQGRRCTPERLRRADCALGLVGVALGLAAAPAVTRVMASMLVNVQPTDPYTSAVTAVLFLQIVAMACWVPARHAARLAPAVALRQE